jgi:hypothetical protein
LATVPIFFYRPKDSPSPGMLQTEIIISLLQGLIASNIKEGLPYDFEKNLQAIKHLIMFIEYLEEDVDSQSIHVV